MPQRSDSAADAAGLERLGLWIVGLKQQSAGRGETTAAVRKHAAAEHERLDLGAEAVRPSQPSPTRPPGPGFGRRASLARPRG
jgi:hypothetical protein